MALVWAFGVCGLEAASAKPNMVIFLADDHGYLDSAVYGGKDFDTPNMVRLARDGMALTRAFVASPSCAPSRAALLTGLMPARNGAEVNHARPRAEIKKLPAYLKELGYEVVAFGKVSHYKQTGDYGFDHFAHDTFHDHKAIPAALKWLKERRSAKPLCLFVGSNWPHVPWPEEKQPDVSGVTLPPTLVPTPETLRSRSFYKAAVAKMDAELGKIYDAAKQQLGTNTLFIHTSDHGAQFPFGKWNCYDAGIRTSFLAVWPGVIQAGSRSDAMVSWIDILPTLVEAGAGKPPEDIDGRSFLPVLKGEKAIHREVIFATHTADGKINNYPMRSLRTAKWKYISNLTREARYTTHIDLDPDGNRRGYWGGYWESWVEAARTEPESERIVNRYHQRPSEELYYLPDDPHEQRNLAGERKHAEQLEKFRNQLKEEMEW